MFVFCSIDPERPCRCCNCSNDCENCNLDDDNDCKCKCFCNFLFISLSLLISFGSMITVFGMYNEIKNSLFNLNFTNDDKICSDNFTNELYLTYYKSNMEFQNSILTVGMLYFLIMIIQIVFVIIQGLEECIK